MADMFRFTGEDVEERRMGTGEEVPEGWMGYIIYATGKVEVKNSAGE
jgi:hypothetical protein